MHSLAMHDVYTQSLYDRKHPGRASILSDANTLSTFSASTISSCTSSDALLTPSYELTGNTAAPLRFPGRRGRALTTVEPNSAPSRTWGFATKSTRACPPIPEPLNPKEPAAKGHNYLLSPLLGETTSPSNEQSVERYARDSKLSPFPGIATGLSSTMPTSMAMIPVPETNSVVGNKQNSRKGLGLGLAIGGMLRKVSGKSHSGDL
ncbi:uncharacterized protein STEHIDRAFT_161857 [Stereum hirsutum FP-91666 SS1]|uniref:uncharacterized protein n=1 Tax=Stereum hirsutum (strain FP-91666) TaxID=721885 RepID=UPI000444A84C|nr:uncharacterized protein STEHIDRAFT_161857 [Stereum hirsutum FP-91666 SS1]EIM81685.1 hypothetical protein STEHIDRAFT_161857 [Stereum hirsutum FP-91666 SS1]